MAKNRSLVIAIVGAVVMAFLVGGIVSTGGVNSPQAVRTGVVCSTGSTNPCLNHYVGQECNIAKYVGTCKSEKSNVNVCYCNI